MPPPTARDASARLLAVALGIGVGVGAALCGVRALGLLEWAELRLYDRFVDGRAGRGGDPPIALVRIREDEIRAHGHPLPDRVLADALTRLSAARPRAIGVALYRDARPVPGEETARAALARAFADDPGIVFIEKLAEPGEPGVPAPDFTLGGDRVGFSDLAVDADGAIRRGLLILWDEDDVPALSFSLRLALQYLAEEGVSMTADPARPEWVRLGHTTVPPIESHDGGYVGLDAGGYQFLLDFAGGPGAFPSYSLEEVMSGSVPDAALRDRVVILGTTAPSVKDEFQTPLLAGPIYGIELHAHAVDQLLRFAAGSSAPVRFWREPGELLWIVAWAALGALLATRIRSPLPAALGAVAALALLAGVAWLAFRAGVWIPLVPPAVAGVGAGGLALAEVTRRERAERAAVMDLFGRYVSRNVADELWSRRDEFMDGSRPRPQRLAITAMLTDLKGYTSAAEKMDPAALMEWVNEYMDVMTRVIEEHGGFVDDYTGDGIKANFGVPIGRSDLLQVGEDARTAVRCALAMGRALEDLDADWQSRGLPRARMRIGLFTGEAVVGSLGSAQRMKFTTVGDTVNTAARLEGFRKEDFEEELARPGAPLFRILIGESTRLHLGDVFVTESLGEHVLRGRGEPVAIHRVLETREGGAS
ncbi:MAG: CHASE2 domain-containing protein [Myxococcota bacterium]